MQFAVRFLAPNAVRITHALAGADMPPDRPWLDHILPPTPPVPEAERRIQATLADGRVRLLGPDGTEILAEARPPRLGLIRRMRSLSVDIPATEIRPDFGQVKDAVQLTLKLRPGEGLYGWGEWFNAFRRERGRIKLKIRDAIALLQHRETYAGLPVFLSDRGYLFWLLNSYESEWVLDPERGELRLEAAGPGADYVVIHGPDFKTLLRTYTQLSGRPPLIPRWAFGLMVTGYPQEHQSVVEARVQEHRQRDIPLDAVILDYQWEERYHNFRWRRSLIPDPDRLLRELKARGVRLGLILTPFANFRNRPGQRLLLNTLASNLPPGLERDDERDLEGYAEGLAAGYFAHPNARWWFGAGGMVDFANPAAAAWWNARMRPLYDWGVAFFKNDDGEYLPVSARSALGLDGREYHNLYGFFYGRALYEGMAALDDRRPFIYARSTWVGSQRYPAIFLGDQKPEFRHIQSALRAGLNMSLLGFAYWTADVFGLDGQTTPETHMRYAQFALLAPVARYFWRPPQADNTRLPWSHGRQAEANFRAVAQLRYRLLPYYNALAWEAWQTGLPLARPLLLEYPGDVRLRDVADQVMLGADILLAPVMEAGAVRRRIVLPEGVWHDYWTAQTWTGPGVIEVDAPLDRLPVLARGGSILPLGPAMPFIPDGHRFDRLSLQVWPPYPARGVLHDDDGWSRAYQRGEYSVTRFEAQGQAGKRITLTVHAAEGDFPGQSTVREIEIVLERAPAPPVEVRVNGQAVSGWSHDPQTQRVTCPVTCPVSAQTAVEFIWV